MPGPDFQTMILSLQDYWARQGCVVLQPYDAMVGAATFCAPTFLRALGPDPWRAAHVQPCRRPTDGRYGDNPFRFQRYYQFQVVVKPAPSDAQALYLGSLEALGIDVRAHDVRFVEDDWESPTLGATGLGWEVWLDGMEVTQFTYFQQVGGYELDPVTLELTYGLERIAMYLQDVQSGFDIRWVGDVTWGDVCRRDEREFSAYNFEHASVDVLTRHFDDHENECTRLGGGRTAAARVRPLHARLAHVQPARRARRDRRQPAGPLHRPCPQPGAGLRGRLDRRRERDRRDWRTTMIAGRRRAPLVLGLLCAAALLLPSAALAGGFSPELQRALARQDELAEKGHMDRVLRDARSGAKSGTAEAYYLLGRALGVEALRYKSGKDERGFLLKLEEAREAFLEAQDVGGDLFTPAKLGLARCSIFESDWATAEQQLRQVLRREPQFREAVLDLVRVLWQRGSQRAAANELAAFASRNQNDVEVQLQLGQMWIQLQQWPQSESALRAALTAQQRDRSVKAETANLTRRLLAETLMQQEKYAEAVTHFDTLSRATPNETDLYIAMFECHRLLRNLDGARDSLRRLLAVAPNSDAAKQARSTLADLDRAAEAARAGSSGNTAGGGAAGAGGNASLPPEGPPSPSALLRRLTSGDDAQRLRALRGMLDFEWTVLPSQVYDVLDPSAASAEVRTAAVELIGDHADPRTLPLLEVLLFHPKERDPDNRVRAAAASAVAALESAASVPVLYRMLDESDLHVREAGVRGIAERTGKWFRPALDQPTSVAAWPAERAKYARWWTSSSGSLAKLEAAQELVDVFGAVQHGRARLARYVLDGLDDTGEATWRASYDLFRKLTGSSFGWEAGTVSFEQRRTVAQQARAWWNANGGGAR